MEHIAEGATKTAVRKMVPQHVVPAEENIEIVETDELELQKPEQVGAIVKEHDNEKVSVKYFFGFSPLVILNSSPLFRHILFKFNF